VLPTTRTQANRSILKTCATMGRAKKFDWMEPNGLYARYGV
jgi:hypothetical protein